MPHALVPLFDYTDDLQAVKDAEVLEAHGIPCRLEHDFETFNPAFTLKASLNAVHLLVEPSARAEARQLLTPADAEAPEPTVESLLVTWSDRELLAVAACPDEWNPGTVAAAEALLRRRGVSLSDAARDENDRRRMRTVGRPRRGDPVWITLGFASALAYGLGGILIGLFYRLLTEPDPHGVSRPAYDERTRRLGAWMIALGTIGAAVAWGVAVFT